jgi:membrane protein DedA with SNARE-associated domain
MFDWITEFVSYTGYFGVLLLMFSENLFPPIPSELIMPLAGFTAAAGELNIVLAVIAGAAGSLLGALFWYYVGLWLGGGGACRVGRRGMAAG